MGAAHGRTGEAGGERRVTWRRQAAFWGGVLLAFLFFVWLLSGILLPFIMGMALAYLLDPIADRLEMVGFSRFWATIAIVLIAVLSLALAMVIVAPVLIGQLSALLDHLPSYAARLQSAGNHFFETRLGRFFGHRSPGANIDQMVSQGVSWVIALLGSVWAGGQALIGAASLLVVTPVVAFYLLYDWDRMLLRLDSLIPRDHVETVHALAHDIDRALAGFVRGQGALCLTLGLYYAAALSLIGLNFGFLIGCAAGLISFIPFVGSIVGFVTAVGVAMVQFWPDWIWIIAVAAVFFFGQFLEGYVLQPRLVGSSVGVHPVWLMFALFAFGALFGFVGMLLAVPATAAIGVLVRFGTERYRSSPMYWGGSERFIDDGGDVE
jgi:predicted PurR-regulated permease PerM